MALNVGYKQSKEVIMDIVLATTNEDKVIEIRKALEGLPINLIGLSEFKPIGEVIEDELTFEKNAYKKASFTAKALGMPAIADDSGLVVDALDGWPGIFSARYASEKATYKENCTKLLKDMEGKTNREAYFKCAMAIVVPFGTCAMYTGKCDGYITEKAAREEGFGYDPIFFCNEINDVFSEVSIDVKNTVSHRGKALLEIKYDIDRIVYWINSWAKL